MADGSKGLLALAIAFFELLKVAVWPTIVVAFVVVFWVPISGLMDRAPTIADRAQTISFGNFKVELSEELAERVGKIQSEANSARQAGGGKADVDLSEVISGLNKSEISELLELTSSGQGFCGDFSLQEQFFITMEEKDLFHHEVGDDFENSRCFNVRLSKLGADVKDFLIDFIASGFGSSANSR